MDDERIDLHSYLEEHGLLPHPQDDTNLPKPLMDLTDRSPLAAAAVAALLPAVLCFILATLALDTRVLLPFDLPAAVVYALTAFTASILAHDICRDFFWRGGLAYEVTNTPDGSGGVGRQRIHFVYRPPYPLYRAAGLAASAPMAVALYAYLTP